MATLRTSLRRSLRRTENVYVPQCTEVESNVQQGSQTQEPESASYESMENSRVTRSSLATAETPMFTTVKLDSLQDNEDESNSSLSDSNSTADPLEDATPPKPSIKSTLRTRKAKAQRPSYVEDDNEDETYSSPPEEIDVKVQKVKSKFTQQQRKVKVLHQKIRRLTKRNNKLNILLDIERRKNNKDSMKEEDTEKISENVNAQKICRTCLSEGKLQPLYTKCKCTTEEKCITEMLLACTLVQFNEEEDLPRNICADCVKEVSISYKFAKKCEKSDEILRKRFQIASADESESKINIRKLRARRSIKDKTSEQDMAADETKIKKEENINKEAASEQIETKNNNNSSSSNNNNNSSNSNVVENNIDSTVKSEPKDVVKDADFVGDNDFDDDFGGAGDYSDTDSDFVPEESPETTDRAQDASTTEKKTRRKRDGTKKTPPKPKSQPPYECKKCWTSYPTFQALREHRKEAKHPKINYSNVNCPICGKTVKHRRIKQHLRTHSSEKPYCCDQCGGRFSNGGNLRRHILTKHSDEIPYRCEVCEKGFKRVEVYKEHLRIHTGEKPYICNICGKSFTQFCGLRAHIPSHEEKGDPSGHVDEKTGQFILNEEHQCKVCQKIFATKFRLKQHEVIHGEKKFLCSFCGKGFTRMIALQNHQVVHTGLKRFHCKLCPKSFCHNQALRIHMLTHTGEKPHVCKICNKAFKQLPHLKYHTLTHTGEKPHICSFCGKGFALNANLTVHMRTHTGETPYICPVCGKGFYDSSSMKKHKKGHGNIVPEQPLPVPMM